MIHVNNVMTLEGEIADVTIPSPEERVIDATGLTLIPALIDAHVHFRTPGLEHKENWERGALAAIRGGITTVFDMPNTLPPTHTLQRLKEKQTLVQAQLKRAEIPLRYGFYLGADKHSFDELERCRQEVVALKIFMGSSTGNLVMNEEAALHEAFSRAASCDLLIAVHAEDEALIHERTKQFQGRTDAQVHSEIRNDEVAFRATRQAIELSRLYGTRLLILHVGTKRELALIKQAKEEGLPVFAETTPHHLFLNQEAYAIHGTKVQINPPLRTQEDQEALWKAIEEGVIDTIGSDHAPHSLEEKNRPYGQAPSGIPGVETTLPLLLNASYEGKLSLKTIVSLMRERVQTIFRLPPNEDMVLLNLNERRVISEKNLATKCGWSPYTGIALRGWPVLTLLRGKVYEL
jgi:dihydroorotase